MTFLLTLLSSATRMGGFPDDLQKVLDVGFSRAADLLLSRLTSGAVEICINDT